MATPTFTGRVGSLSPEQQAALKEFKEEITKANVYDPEKHSDHTLLRFLRARKFKLPATMKMWTDYITWRKEFAGGVDELVKTFEFKEKDAVFKLYPRYYHKTDKEGRPVYIEHYGKVNLKELEKVTSLERQLQWLVVEYEKLISERLVATSADRGHHIEQTCTILDLKDASLSQFYQVQDFVKSASAISQNYYPEMLGRMFVINAPFLFSGIWAVVKLFLDEVTVKKINILGSSYPILFEAVDKENLPVSIGGTCKCSPSCELGDEGPWKHYDAAKAVAAPAEKPADA